MGSRQAGEGWRGRSCIIASALAPCAVVWLEALTTSAAIRKLRGAVTGWRRQEELGLLERPPEGEYAFCVCGRVALP